MMENANTLRSARIPSSRLTLRPNVRKTNIAREMSITLTAAEENVLLIASQCTASRRVTALTMLQRYTAAASARNRAASKSLSALQTMIAL